MTTEKSADADFAEVFAREDRDSGADTAAPVEQGQPRAPDGKFASKDAQQEAAAPPVPDATPEQAEPKTSRNVPLSELMSEREKRKAETKLREEAETRARDHEAKVQAYERQLRQLQQRTQAPAQPQPPPDFFTDPDAAVEHRMQQIMRTFTARELNRSERAAVKTYGKETVDAAFEAASQAGIASQFVNSEDAYDDLVQWHQKTKAFQEIGPDPTAYRTKLETEIRAKVLAELKQGGTQQPQNFPGSLASATGSGGQGAHLNIETVANDIFASNRNRRA